MGNARTAVLNWMFARRHGGAFILRFEDTDSDRHVEGAEQEILEALDWLGLDRDEDPAVGGPYGPYRQSERLSIYRDTAQRLLEQGRAFRCYCTTEELEDRRVAARAVKGELRYDGRCRQLSPQEEDRLVADGRAPSIRFQVDPGRIHYTDRIRGDLSVDGEELGDQVILRSDGRPTYNFAAVVDDRLMEITHVIRGAGHLSNTPKQVLLYGALGAEPPEFLHLPSVLAPGGGKLSKRAGATGLLEYREEGYHPDGVVNYLSLLSWSSPSGDEVLSRQRLVDELDLDRIGKANPELDPEKLRWLSGQHFRAASTEEIERALEDRLAERFELDASFVRPLAEVARDRILVLADADAICELVVPDPDLTTADAAEALAEATSEDVLRSVGESWATAAEWTRGTLRETLLTVGRQLGVKGRQLYHPVRAALTGAVQGPDVPDVAYILGRQRSLERIEAGRRAAAASGK